MAASVESAADLRREVSYLDWYHTIELAPGVVTPGWFDTRKVVSTLPLPADLRGKRCLDVGTFDGFWAFEMARRGADEVVAVDLLDPAEWDWPVSSAPTTIAALNRRKRGGAGFDLAQRTLQSTVTRLERSVYDLDASETGTFDFVYLGSLLLHLRDPVRALERVRDVCAGQMLVVDNIDLPLTLVLRRRPVAALDGRGRPWWWKPNLVGLGRMVEAAGFRVLGRPRRLYMPPGRGQRQARLRPRTLLTQAGREATMTRWKGDPHGVILAEPVESPPRRAGSS